jgi:hypothetical protein
MKKLIRSLCVGVITVGILTTFTLCSKPNVQDGPEVEDSTNATNSANSTVTGDTVKRVDTVDNKKDSMVMPQP